MQFLDLQLLFHAILLYRFLSCHFAQVDLDQSQFHAIGEHNKNN